MHCHWERRAFHALIEGQDLVEDVLGKVEVVSLVEVLTRKTDIMLDGKVMSTELIHVERASERIRIGECRTLTDDNAEVQANIQSLLETLCNLERRDVSTASWNEPFSDQCLV